MFSATTTENIKGFLTIARGRVRTKTNWRSLSSSAAVRVAGENSCLPSPRPFEYLYTKVAGKKAVAAFSKAVLSNRLDLLFAGMDRAFYFSSDIIPLHNVSANKSLRFAENKTD